MVFNSGDVRANTNTYFANPPPVIKHFVPFRTYSCVLSSNIAVVLALPASDPAFGSVRANAPNSPPEHTTGKYFSVPNFPITEAKIVCIESVAAVEPQYFAISSTAITFSISLPPLPPYFSSVPIPVNPILVISKNKSFGNFPLLSISSALGFTTFSLKSATVFLSINCALEKLKSISFPPLDYAFFF